MFRFEATSWPSVRMLQPSPFLLQLSDQPGEKSAISPKVFPSRSLQSECADHHRGFAVHRPVPFLPGFRVPSCFQSVHLRSGLWSDRSVAFRISVGDPALCRAARASSKRRDFNFKFHFWRHASWLDDS